MPGALSSKNQIQPDNLIFYGGVGVPVGVAVSAGGLVGVTVAAGGLVGVAVGVVVATTADVAAEVAV